MLLCVVTFGITPCNCMCMHACVRSGGCEGRGGSRANSPVHLLLFDLPRDARNDPLPADSSSASADIDSTICFSLLCLSSHSDNTVWYSYESSS